MVYSAFRELEPYDGKLSSTVLRGQGRGNPPELPDKYSDEFNGTELDLNKWFDYHPTWAGRAPGLFMPSQVEVKDGYLQISGEKMETPVTVNGQEYNIKCGAVVSRRQSAFFGYYECKFKANKTTLSSTFWFSNRKNFDGPADCNDKYSQEWDIQECIGREGDFNGSWFAKGMHSNAHYWYTDCEGERHDYRAPNEVRFEDTKLASEQFDIYGGWWKDETQATYYYNNTESKSHTFYNQVSSKPFSQPMGLNLVVETYPYPWIELPTDEELADPDKTTTYYDWVRAYELVDVFEPYSNEKEPEVADGDFESGELTKWGGWGSPSPAITDQSEHVSQGTYAGKIVGAGAINQNLILDLNTDYRITFKAKALSGTISFGVKDNQSGTTLQSVNVSSNSYDEYTLEFNTLDYTDLKMYFYAQAGEEGYIDDVVMENLNGGNDTANALPEIFTETIELGPDVTQEWDEKVIWVPLTFKANKDRDIHLELRNPENVLIADTVLTAYAGYGKAVVALAIDSLPTSDPDYYLNGDIRTSDGTSGDVINTKSISINLNTDTAIPDVARDQLKVYPQPVTGELFIENIIPGTPFLVYNLYGQVVIDGDFNGTSINVSDLDSGIFLLQAGNKKTRFVKK